MSTQSKNSDSNAVSGIFSSLQMIIRVHSPRYLRVDKFCEFKGWDSCDIRM